MVVQSSSKIGFGCLRAGVFPRHRNTGKTPAARLFIPLSPFSRALRGPTRQMRWQRSFAGTRVHLRPPFAAAPSISPAIKNPLSQQFLLGQGNHSPAVPPKLASKRPLAPHTTMCAPLVTGGGPVGHYSAVRLSSRPHESIQSGALPAALSPPAALWKGALRTYSSQSTVFWNMVSFYSAPAVLSRGKIVLFGARHPVGRNDQALPPGAPGRTAGAWGSTSGCAGQALRQSPPHKGRKAGLRVSSPSPAAQIAPDRGRCGEGKKAVTRPSLRWLRGETAPSAPRARQSGPATGWGGEGVFHQAPLDCRAVG